MLALGLVAALMASCGSVPPEEDAALLAQAAKANAEDTFDVGQVSSRLHLAVEVEVTADGIRPTGVTIVRGPEKAGSAMADLLVRARAGDEVIAEYTMPDPRLVEIESETWMTLDAERTIVFAPLVPELTELEIVPVEGREPFVSKGGVVELQPLVRKACEEQPELEECRKILGSRGAVRVILGGKEFDIWMVQQAIVRAVPWADLSEEAFPNEDTAFPVDSWRGRTVYEDARDEPYEPDMTWVLLDEAGVRGDFWINLVYARDDDKLAVVTKGVDGALARVDIPVKLWAVGSDEIADVIAELIESGQMVMALIRG
jgi:hypothetical protein